MKLKSVKFDVSYNQRATQQVIGREGETATLLSRCLLNSNGLGGGFAPRQLNRYICESRVETKKQTSKSEFTVTMN